MPDHQVPPRRLETLRRLASVMQEAPPGVFPGPHVNSSLMRAVIANGAHVIHLDAIDAAHMPLPLLIRLTHRGRFATLLAPFHFLDAPRAPIEVPAGFQTDFNSVPWGLWNAFPPWEYPEAAVVHDYLYRVPASASRLDADRVHRRILDVLGCPWWKRWSAFAALRAFGWKPWNQTRALTRA